jgi:hypothetical protein
MTDPFERRKHPRAEADFTLALDAVESGDGSILVKDVSRAGICCVLPEPVKLMTEVGMRLEIPTGGGQTAPVEVQGAVVRCDPLSEATRAKAQGRLGDDAYEVAIFFLHMDEEDREIIDAYVKSRSRIATGPLA